MQPGRRSLDCTRFCLQNLTQMSTLGAGAHWDRGTLGGASFRMLFLNTMLHAKRRISASELEKEATSAPSHPSCRLSKALGVLYLESKHMPHPYSGFQSQPGRRAAPGMGRTACRGGLT